MSDPKYGEGVSEVLDPGGDLLDERTTTTSYDKNAMLVDSTKDPNGLVSTNSWDKPKDRLLSKKGPIGLVTTYTYDDTGQLKNKTGPVAPGETEAGRNVTRNYDETFTDKDPQGKPMHGLQTVYWDGDSWAGKPAKHEFGPDADKLGSLDISWSKRPIAGKGPWSARLSESIEIATKGDYDFEVSPGAQLYIGSQGCGGQKCTIKGLPEGKQRLRVDLKTSDPSGTGSMSVHWRPPAPRRWRRSRSKRSSRTTRS